jgi:hypothetical protein
LTNCVGESETCVGSRVHLVGVSISFEKNFYRLPFTPPFFGSPFRSFRGRHKLSPPWEGPYIIVKLLKPGTYKWANEDGEERTNAWNIQ